MTAIKKSRSITGTSLQFMNKLMDDKQSFQTSSKGTGNRQIIRTPGREMVDVVSRLIMHFEKES